MATKLLYTILVASVLAVAFVHFSQADISGRYFLNYESKENHLKFLILGSESFPEI